MKFGYTIMYVRDVPQTVAFYEKAFNLKQRFIHESNQYGEMETGQTTIAFADNQLAQSNLPSGFQENSLLNPPHGMEIGFVVDDVQDAFNCAVEAGAINVVQPKIKPWGQTVAYVRDLDGVLISINSRM
jgi:lactoylglutathione lyase